MTGTSQRAARTMRRAAPECGEVTADGHLAGLVSTIEREIIPRLVLAHRGGRPVQPATADGAAELGAAQVAEVCALLVGDDLAALLAYVQRLRERGTALERIYLDLFAPAARRLGELWLADECDFTTVTLGLWRLHQALHELSPSFQFDSASTGDGRRVLLAATPGEQHTFGLFMVAEFFRRAGWEVFDGPSLSAAELAEAVRHDWFTLAGFSLSGDGHVDRLAALIRDVRRASRNRAIGIIVGGVVFAEHPELVAVVGADSIARDGREAVALADSMLAERAQRRAG